MVDSNKDQEFERIVKDINIQPVIDEEVRKVKTEKDFIFHEHYLQKGHAELEKVPSVEHTLGSNLNKILGALGFNNYKNEYHENEDS